MRTSAFVLLVVSSLALAACAVTVEGPSGSVKGSGAVTTEVREVAGFDKLNLSGLGDVRISQGSVEALTVEAEDNILPQIKSEVRSNTLYIGFTQEKWQDRIIPTKSIKFTLTVKDLTSIESSGAANIETDGLKTTSLKLKLLGAGNVKFNDLQVSSMDTTLSGAGSIDLKGQAAQQTVTLSGVGSYRAGDLKSQAVKVTVSGAGSATVWATDTLNATISGVGSVSYYGSPAVTKTVSGIGSVKSLGAKE